MEEFIEKQSKFGSTGIRETNLLTKTELAPTVPLDRT